MIAKGLYYSKPQNKSPSVDGLSAARVLYYGLNFTVPLVPVLMASRYC